MLKLLLEAAYVQFNILSLLVVEVFIYTYFGCRCIITFLEINDLLLFMFSVLLMYFSFCPRYLPLRFLGLQPRSNTRRLDLGASRQIEINGAFLKIQEHFSFVLPSISQVEGPHRQ